MNLDYVARRLLGRPTCILNRGAKLYRCARIRNASGKDSEIRVGSHSMILGELLTFAHGGQIQIGTWCYIGEGTRIWSAARILIGDRVLIAHNVNIFDSLTHPVSASARHRQFQMIVTSGHPKEIDLGEQEITIGSDAWIGANAKLSATAAAPADIRIVRPFMLHLRLPQSPPPAQHRQAPGSSRA